MEIENKIPINNGEIFSPRPSKKKNTKYITEKIFASWLNNIPNKNLEESVSIVPNHSVNKEVFYRFLHNFGLTGNFLRINYDVIFPQNSNQNINQNILYSNICLIRNGLLYLDDPIETFEGIESSNCNVYIDRKSGVLYKDFCHTSSLEMIRESYVQYLLHKIDSAHISNVFGLYKMIDSEISKPNKEKYVYFLAQNYFKDGTLYHRYRDLNRNQLLNMLIKLCDIMENLQNRYDFLHNDLKSNNICIDIESENVYLIDFGYSSLVYNGDFISSDFDLNLSDFLNSKKFISFLKQNRKMNNDTINQNIYKNSGDLFYLIYTLLYYQNDSTNPLYDVLHPLFNVYDINFGTMNIFDIMASRELSSQHIGFFITKSYDMFKAYFGENIRDIDLFYTSFLPYNLKSYLKTFL
jgi:hypothetical protein